MSDQPTKGASMNFQLPILSAGRGEPGTNKVCAEQAVNWLVSGRLDLGDETDRPECVQPVLNALAIHVNDTVSDEDRQRMWPIILRQPGTAHPEMEPVLSVRLACYLVDQVFDLVWTGDQAVCREAIDAARAWCDDPSDKNLQRSKADNEVTHDDLDYIKAEAERLPNGTAAKFLAALDAMDGATDRCDCGEDTIIGCGSRPDRCCGLNADEDTVTITISREDAEFYAKPATILELLQPYLVRLNQACRAALSGEENDD